MDLWKTGTFLHDGRRCKKCGRKFNVKAGVDWSLCVICHIRKRIDVIRKSDGEVDYILRPTTSA